MASEFAEDFSGFPAIHFSGSFLGLDAAAMEDSGSLGLAGYSGYGFSEAHLDDLPVSLPAQCPVQDPLPFIQAGKRRKSVTVPCGAAAPGGAASAGVKTRKKDSSRKGGRRGRCCGEEEEEEEEGEVEMKTKEVVHVRAKRGQATDSHSLAERLRREKINEKMRCLQDLVPGCYKAMGTAVLLDEIINYVQSLQNQIEFLSMKLSAASAVNDFRSDAEAAAARWPPRSALHCPPTSSGDGVPVWDQAPPPSADTASGEIFLECPFPLSMSVHQFPQWNGQ